MSFKGKSVVRFSSQQPSIISFAPKRRSNITTTGMIKKWKVSPVSTRTRTTSEGEKNEVPARAKGDAGISIQKGSNIRGGAQNGSKYPVTQSTTIVTSIQKSKDDTTASTEKKSQKLPRKPRRNTTGGGKQTAEDIRRAKELAAAMNDDRIVNEIDQEIDPNSTLGRKQLIAMLKQRYGPEIENFRSSEVSEKERVRRERQRERDMRHEQRASQDNRELYHHNGVHHSPAVNGNRRYKHGLPSRSSSDCSDDPSYPSSPNVRRAVITKSTTITHQTGRKSNSDDDIGKSDPGYYTGQHVTTVKQRLKDVVFLQYRDEVKRVNLPPSINSVDTMKALFVNAFPGKVAMPHFEEGYQSIYIKDMETGVYYQLEDTSEVVNRSFLKIQEIDMISESRSEADAYAFRTQTLPTKGKQKDYAESLQDYQLTTPRMKKETSGTALKIDSVITRPSHTNDTGHHLYAESNGSKVGNSEENKVESQYNPILKRRAGNETKQSVTVQDQLEDLSELLRTALNEEDKHHAEILQECVDIKNPGKINQNLIDNLQNSTESNARKVSLPKHFQPTAIVMAQQESDRRTPDAIKSSVKMTVTSRRQESKLPENKSAQTAVQPITPRVTEGYISPANRLHYIEHSNSRSKEMDVDVKQLDSKMQTANLSVPASAHQQSKQEIKSKNTKTNIIDDTDYSEKIANDLLSQLMDLEEEVKAQSSRSSRKSSLQSNTSTSSKSSLTASDTMKSNTIKTIEEDMNRTRVASMPVHHVSARPEPRSASLSSDTSQPVYATINKPIKEVPTKSHTITTFNASNDEADGDVFNDTATSTPKKQTAEIWKPPSLTTPDFLELETTAKDVTKNLRALKSEWENLRKYHIDCTRNFKADLQKKLLEFRKKAARVEDQMQQKLDLNNNFFFANEHPVRERRHRLTADQVEYGNKVTDTENRLQSLEGNMEMFRIEVVNKKRVEDPDMLENMHNELTGVTKGLAEIKNRYHGLHDMLKVVMSAENEIIKKEQIFLKEEPEKLEKLIVRCRALSETLFTLQKLASVQGLSPVSPTSKKSFTFPAERNNNNDTSYIGQKGNLHYQEKEVKQTSVRYPNVKQR